MLDDGGAAGAMIVALAATEREIRFGVARPAFRRQHLIGFADPFGRYQEIEVIAWPEVRSRIQGVGQRRALEEQDLDGATGERIEQPAQLTLADRIKDCRRADLSA